MDWTVLFILTGLCAALMALEMRGVRTTLSLQFKGDLKRETAWLAQYGQSFCTPLAALLVWQLDPNPHPKSMFRCGAIVVAVLGVSVFCLILKRSLGRVRPNRENAGKFLGPSLRHANFRESFPSSHSACAVALSVMLAAYYPGASWTFWGLAIGCALLRYALDAHWPSDVAGGIALGYGAAHVTLWAYHQAGWL